METYMHLEDATWQLLADTIAHGAPEHRKWLIGMISGFAAVVEGHPVRITDSEEGKEPKK